MASLGKALHDTIRNLEKMRDSQDPPSDEILAKLDTLYEQQIDLIDAAIKKNSKAYKRAVNTMKKAAERTQEAVDDLAKVEQSLDKVSNAIGKVTELLSKVS
ncbi:MAG: hypothetical protein KZQ99_05265 [Candidatus Thiodiazotropha sp. (ex Dulcina madagascariensis)]|nr:hypothetical protein [Candidatus Thiodiazotropha sp. (ex Dulcina madagascariensis)]